METISLHLIHGLKTALASVLAFAVTRLLQLEFGYWAVITAVIVMQIYVADSVEMCLNRFSGTLAGAVMGAAVMLAVPKNDLSLGLALFFAIGICSFLTRYQSRYKLAAITVVIIMLTGLESDNIIGFALFRVLEILIGILCAFAVTVLIFPRKRADALLMRLDAQAQSCSELCIRLVDAFLDYQQSVPFDLADRLVKDAADNHALLRVIDQHETLIYHKEADSGLQARNALINGSAAHLHTMVRTLNAPTEEGYDIIMADELRALANQSCDTLCRVISGRSVPDLAPLENMLLELDTKLIRIRQEGAIRRFDSKKLIQIFSFYSSLQYFAEDILTGARKITTPS